MVNIVKELESKAYFMRVALRQFPLFPSMLPSQVTMYGSLYLCILRVDILIVIIACCVCVYLSFFLSSFLSEICFSFVQTVHFFLTGAQCSFSRFRSSKKCGMQRRGGEKGTSDLADRCRSPKSLWIYISFMLQFQLSFFLLLGLLGLLTLDFVPLFCSLFFLSLSISLDYFWQFKIYLCTYTFPSLPYQYGKY